VWTSVTDKVGNSQNVRRSNTSGAAVMYSPTLPTPGFYDISVWLPGTTGTWLPSGGVSASSITVDVYHRNGMTTETVTLPVDAGTSEGRWVQVGTAPYLFNATTSGMLNPPKVAIRVATNNGVYLPADAVRFSKVGTFGVYMDESDQIGIGLNPNPGTWSVFGSPRTAQNWLYHKNLMFGPIAKRAITSSTQEMTYAPALPELGLYDTFIWYPFSATNSHTTTVTVASEMGQVVRTVDQEQEAGKWTFAGRYILKPGVATLKITSTGNTSDYTMADGVLFLRDGEELDLDGDTLVDWYEQMIGTSTVTADINGDGRADGWDTDGDGMNDGDEVRLGRDPLKTAVDGSGVMSLTVFTPTTR
jgi:hypothetical protein